MTEMTKDLEKFLEEKYVIVWGETCDVDIFNTKKDIIKFLTEEGFSIPIDMQDFIDGKCDLLVGQGGIGMEENGLNWICKANVHDSGLVSELSDEKFEEFMEGAKKNGAFCVVGQACLERFINTRNRHMKSGHCGCVPEDLHKNLLLNWRNKEYVNLSSALISSAATGRMELVNATLEVYDEQEEIVENETLLKAIEAAQREKYKYDEIINTLLSNMKRDNMENIETFQWIKDVYNNPENYPATRGSLKLDFQIQ